MPYIHLRLEPEIGPRFSDCVFYGSSIWYLWVGLRSVIVRIHGHTYLSFVILKVLHNILRLCYNLNVHISFPLFLLRLLQ